MQYRNMPNASEQLSLLGYGVMRMPTKRGKEGGMATLIDAEKSKKLIRYAIDNGVNYLDTAYPYHRGTSESFLGEHILTDGYREKVYIATKMPIFSINKADRFDEIFEKQLKKLKVDYIDYYLLHSLEGSTWRKMKRLGVIEWMDKIRASGKVKRMGFSFHGLYEDFIKIVDEYDWEFVQVQYNILDVDFQAGIKGIRYAHGKGMGVIVMEPLRGGALVNKIPKEVKEIYHNAPIKRSAAEWALRWIYDQPEVALVLSGMNSLEQIKENIRVAEQTLAGSMSEAEHKIIEQVRQIYRQQMTVACTGCGYCVPCPEGINIPDMLKGLNNYHATGKMLPTLFHTLRHGVMTPDHKPHYASSCTQCGKCEKKCPQHIEIRKELKHVAKDMESPILKAGAALLRPAMNKKKKT